MVSHLATDSLSTTCKDEATEKTPSWVEPNSQDARYHQDYCVFSRESAESHNPSFATIAPWVGSKSKIIEPAMSKKKLRPKEMIESFEM